MFIEWFPTKTCVVVSKEGVSILYNYGFHGIIPSSLRLKPNISFDFNLTVKKIKKK